MNSLDVTKKALKTIWQLKIKKRPIILSHEVNSRCNLDCEYCKSKEKTQKEMSKKAIFDLIDEAKDFGITIYNIWGTEPLLRRDLEEIIEHSKNRGLITSMVTNGVLLKEKTKEINELNYLTVSLDGIKTQKEIRGISYTDVMEGIEKAKEEDIDVGINCVITQKNLKEIPELVKKCKEKDIPITIEPVYNHEEIKSEFIEKYSIKNHENYKKVIKKLIEMKKQGYPIINSKTYLKEIKDLNNKINCKNRLPILHIDSEGRLKMCRIKDQELAPQALKLEKKWIDSKDKREKIAKECKGCQFFGYVESRYLNQLKIEPIINTFRFI